MGEDDFPSRRIRTGRRDDGAAEAAARRARAGDQGQHRRVRAANGTTRDRRFILPRPLRLDAKTFRLLLLGLRDPRLDQRADDDHLLPGGQILDSAADDPKRMTSSFRSRGIFLDGSRERSVRFRAHRIGQLG